MSKDAAELTESVPDMEQVAPGRTFWDWATGKHPKLLRLFIVLVVIVVLVVSFQVSAAIAGSVLAAAAISFFVGWLMFRNAYFWNDAVVLIAFGRDDVTECNIFVIGKEKFRELNHSGNILGFNSSSGDPVYIADYFDGEEIHYPWSFETSRIRFVLQAETFDEVKMKCEDAMKENFRLHNIPAILGIGEARSYVKNYDSVLSVILSGGSPTSAEASASGPEGDQHD